MANFKNDKSGKLYRSTKNIKTEFDASGDNTIDGRIHELLPEKEALGLLPARIKKGGDQAKFFPELEQESGAAGILTGSIVRDTERGIVYVPLTLGSFLKNMVGAGSHISQSFTDTASYQSVSSSLLSQFSGSSSDLTIQYMVEENYSPTAPELASTVIAPFTGSITLGTPLDGGADLGSASFSGIHSSSFGVELLIDMRESVSATHFSMRQNILSGSGGGSALVTRDLKTNFFSQTSSLVFKNSASVSQSFCKGLPYTATFLGSTFLTGSDLLQDGSNTTFISPAASGSGNLSNTGSVPVGSGLHKRINGANESDGTYSAYFFKGRIAGDGDSGSLYSFFNFAPSKNGVEVVIYPKDSVVASASFHYLSSSQVDSGDKNTSDVTGSSNIKTLYYISSSTTPGFAGLFTSSLGPLQLGSLIHEDVELKTTASYGYYSISGSGFTGVTPRTHTFQISTSSQDNDGVDFGQTAMKVPRIVRTFTL